LRHSVSLLHAHLVFVTKYRRPIFTGDILTFCEHTIRAVCAELDAELVEFNGEADHVHLLVAYPSTLAISTLVQRLKGRTAYAVRREFTGACAPPACADTCGRPPTSPSRAEAHRYRSSSNTSTAKHAHFERRAAPGDKQDGLTHGLKPEACAQEVPVNHNSVRRRYVDVRAPHQQAHASAVEHVANDSSHA
jgi:REP element-mobilizing transposase RayT